MRIHLTGSAHEKRKRGKSSEGNAFPHLPEAQRRDSYNSGPTISPLLLLSIQIKCLLQFWQNYWCLALLAPGHQQPTGNGLSKLSGQVTSAAMKCINIIFTDFPPNFKFLFPSHNFLTVAPVAHCDSLPLKMPGCTVRNLFTARFKSYIIHPLLFLQIVFPKTKNGSVN